MLPILLHVPISGTGGKLAGNFLGEQIRLFGFAERGEEVVEIESRPRGAVLHQKSVSEFTS